MDSTGLKVYGEGEWKVRQQGVDKRRDWRNVHLAVDPDSHAILAESTADSRSHAAAAALPLLEQIDAELQTCYGDGAYGQQTIDDAMVRRTHVRSFRPAQTPSSANGLAEPSPQRR